jgi:hypothetical protein
MLTRLDGAPARVLLVVSAALMLVSAGVHLHLWDIAYRHVATLGPLFVVQAIAMVVLAVLLVVWPVRLVVFAAALLNLGTILGFVKAVNGGVFGFTLPVITGWANLALAVELGALVALGGAALAGWASTRPTRSPAATTPSGA